MNVKIQAENDPEQKQWLQIEWDIHKRKAEVAFVSGKTPTRQNMTQTCICSVSTFSKLSQHHILPLSGVLLTPTLDIQLGHTQHCFSKWPHASLVRRLLGEAQMRLHHSLLSYFEQLTTDARHLIAYRDPCGGQKTLEWCPSGLTLCRQGDLTPLTTSFPVPGHSFLPGD